MDRSEEITNYCMCKELYATYLRELLIIEIRKTPLYISVLKICDIAFEFNRKGDDL